MSIELVVTGHILERSVREVQESIREKKPDIVALELDRGRLEGLKNKFYGKEREGKGGPFPLLPFLLEKIQEKLGKRLGVSPGSEMLQALKTAQEEGSKVVLIDRDIGITLNHLLNIPFKEKINLLNLRKFNLGEIKSVEDLLEDEIIEDILKKLEKELPHTYKALIEERDQFMAYNLFQIQQQQPHQEILGVVGAGHKKGILNSLQEIQKKGVGEVNLQENLQEKSISFFQFLSLTFMVLLAFIIIEVSFWRRKK